MKKAVILGAGQGGQAALRLLNKNCIEAIAFGDNNSGLIHDGEIPVLPVSEALSLKPDLVVVSVLDEERSRQLTEQINHLAYKGAVLSLREAANTFDIRGAVLIHLCERIKENNIDGCIAELGVYKGDFARQLNRLFPNRKLYLFDTFCGFDIRDINTERNMHGYSDKEQAFADTNADEVFERMPYKNNVILKIGWFPETAHGLDTAFALVSIDADLYAPTLLGLEYFYPRLTEGGAIILHDYNSARFKGVKRAVSAYEEKHGMLAVTPLCDVHGTAVIVKANERS